MIFAGSVFGAIPFAHFATYSSAKAGLAALALALSRESAGSGVTFTCAVPRAIRTRMASERIRKFAAVAGFRFDDPAAVASRLLAIIRQGSGAMGPGFPESLFMRLHGIAPSLVSAASRARTPRRATFSHRQNDGASHHADVFRSPSRRLHPDPGGRHELVLQ